jgi:2-dehydro-3-deoxygalactonokinase
MLNNIFHVRTGQLSGAIGKKENFYYLSGLLIGAELKDIIGCGYASLTLVAAGELLSLYSNALHMLGFEKKLHLRQADEALINGQCIMLDVAMED